MTMHRKLLLAVSSMLVCGSFTVHAAKINQDLARIVEVEQEVEAKPLLMAANTTPVLQSSTRATQGKFSPVVIKKPATAGVKVPFVFKQGDSELTIGSITKISHVYQDATYLLNRQIPDECEFFKHSIDLFFDAKFGKEKFGHTAVELFTDLRHKGVWGKQATFADKYEAGSVGVSNVKLSESVFGYHSHGTGKPLVYVKDGWLQMSLNAIFGVESVNIHTLKLGWFPFDLGRGIALGSMYGANKEILGLYSYSDDKSAPGILLSGSLVKDVVSYDLYYAKFEERSKSISDTLNGDKKHWVGRRASPWRGVNKDDELFAARIKFNSPARFEKFGDLEIEPYVFVNEASDQQIEIAPDASTRLGATGIAIEYSKNNFEFGGEFASNFGREIAHAIDRNVTKITRIPNVNAAGVLLDTQDQLAEVYSHVIDTTPGNMAIPGTATDEAKKVLSTAYATPSNNNTVYQNNVNPATGLLINNNPDQSIAGVVQVGSKPGSNGLQSKSDRFRPEYKSHFNGWMGVVDAAYTFEDANLKLAAAYGYATGDTNPHAIEADKEFKGFVGLHEWYAGKRVKSILVLDERNLRRPISLPANSSASAAVDLSFSDLQHTGVSLEWKPALKEKTLMLNPNLMFFWKTHTSKKFDIATKKTTDQDARNFMGTELNIISKYVPIKDLSIFANAAAFIPGGFFTDVQGVKLNGDYFEINIPNDARTDADAEENFRLSTSTAFHLNIGFEYRF